MKIVHTNGQDKNFYGLCVQLDEFLNNHVEGRREAGLTSFYNMENLKDIFLLYDGRRAIGSAGLWCHDNDACELIRVFLNDNYRGKGLVRTLVNEVEQLAIQKGYKKIFLRTWMSTPSAPRAYQKLGFLPINKAEFKHADKFPRALPLAHQRLYMSKDLSDPS